LYPDKALWPRDSAARAQARSVSAEMHASFMAVRSEMPMNARASVAGLNFSDDAKSDIARICDIWTECRQGYGSHGPFLFGDFTIADAMYAPIASRFKTYGVRLEGECDTYAAALLQTEAAQKWYKVAREEPWTVEQYELG